MTIATATAPAPAPAPTLTRPAAQFKPGEIVGIPCEVGPGPFSHEKLIAFKSLHGQISGFVRTLDLRQVEDQWQVRARVLEVKDDYMAVWVWGEFFQTSGYAKLPLGLAVPAVLKKHHTPPTPIIQFKKGEIVGIPCEAYPGPFSTEKLIAFKSLHGQISGFVQTLELRQTEDQWQVRAFVKRMEKDRLTVWVRGEFFTTSGHAELPLGLAVPA